MPSSSSAAHEPSDTRSAGEPHVAVRRPVRPWPLGRCHLGAVLSGAAVGTQQSWLEHPLESAPRPDCGPRGQPVRAARGASRGSGFGPRQSPRSACLPAPPTLAPGEAPSAAPSLPTSTPSHQVPGPSGPSPPPPGVPHVPPRFPLKCRWSVSRQFAPEPHRGEPKAVVRGRGCSRPGARGTCPLRMRETLPSALPLRQRASPSPPHASGAASPPFLPAGIVPRRRSGKDSTEKPAAGCAVRRDAETRGGKRHRI